MDRSHTLAVQQEQLISIKMFERKMLTCRNKHQKQLKYPLNKDGFDAIRADLKLMCDNCHTYNIGVQDLEESADMMWKEANKQLDAYYKKALSDISSLMSGQRAR